MKKNKIFHSLTGVFSFAPGFCKLFGILGQLTESDKPSFFIHQSGYHDLFVCP